MQQFFIENPEIQDQINFGKEKKAKKNQVNMEAESEIF